MPIKKDVKFWLAELELAGKHESKWRKRARNVINIYRDDTGTNETHFNILWSNTQTQRPALYSSTPKPVIKRRHRQEGQGAKIVAQSLERALSYSLDPGGSYDFDRVGEKLILDYLLPGRMVARCKYHPEIIESERDIEDEYGDFLETEKFDELIDEEVRVYHIPWDQYRQSVANAWEDVWWVAYGNNFLTQDEVIEQFGEEHSDVPLTHISHMEDKDGQPTDGEERQVKKAQVWEIWDKDERKVYAVIDGYDKFLMNDEDPLKLRGFYPGPEPVMIVETPDSLIPIPEYTLYQYQAAELNKITLRLENLVDAMKLSGLYPGSQKDIIKELLNSKENTLIPVEDWGAITERGGLAGMIEWIPLRDVADAWQRLMVYRTQLVQSIFELTGISDIQRGSTDPRETKGAQQLKASFGNRRFLPKQQDTQRFFRDLFRIQAEIIAEHFQTETIAQMANMEVTPEFEQAREMMKNDALRSYSIDIETDSTIAADEAMEKQGVAEFTAAMSQFLGQIFPIIQAQPAAIGPLGKMLLWMSRKFRIARDAEDEIEEFLQTFSELPEQQDKEGEAKAAQLQADQQMKQAEAQAAQQIKAQESQANLQIKMQESQSDTQRKDAEAKSKIDREERMAILQERKVRLDIAEQEAKIRLMREEAEAKVILSAVDQQSKRASETSKPSESKGQTPSINVGVGESKAKKITLVKDKDGKLTGAEITPVEDKKTVSFQRDSSDKIASAEIE